MLSNIAKYDSNEAHELRALFETRLRELYWVEKSMIPLLAHIVENISSLDLSAVLTDHALETVAQISHLEVIFKNIGIEPQMRKYDAINCLINESEDMLNNTKPGVVRDAGVISVIQIMKHYEIACYGTMKAFAIALREEDIVAMLEHTLNEEKQIDILLTQIAESHINIEAADKEI